MWAILLTFHCSPIEILIVDANNDLNVYKAKGADTPSQCCGADVKSACCEKSSSCCDDSGAVPDGASEPFKGDLANLDFNEWAGTSYDVSRNI